jgi:hypothetical protein
MRRIQEKVQGVGLSVFGEEVDVVYRQFASQSRSTQEHSACYATTIELLISRLCGSSDPAGSGMEV